ncbi:MAG: helix-turn-helix domain-containing protein [Burkholderiaceae bacterium]|jgi:cytoskeleton protein RodZ|nr:helix-turn-helix domain-containing protein [Burkholderiaceae bacterium]
MSERGTGAPDAKLAQKTQPSQPPESAGAILRQMRETAGVDLERIASVLKVSVQNLRALEDDRIDDMPTVTFARGLASAICRAFGVDPAPVLDRMPTSAPALRVPDRRAPAPPVSRSNDQPAPLISDSLAKPVLIAAIVLLIGAILLWLLPAQTPQLDTSPEADEPTAAAAPAAATEQAPSVASSEPQALVAPDTAASDVVPVFALDAAASAPVALPMLETASAPTPNPATTEEVLGMVANSDTWVTVRDASGRIAANRMLVAGDKLSVSGEPPLSVTIGRKSAVTVTVRGKPFDHKSLAPSEIARFTVK